MKKIELITKVKIDNSEFNEERIYEFLDYCDGGIGHDDLPFVILWEEEGCLPLLKKYLIETYGEKIKKYSEFIMINY